jgi:hypothetical protein
MDWLTILAIFGAVGTALSLADLAYKYGSLLFKKIFLNASRSISETRGTSSAVPRIALQLAASPELQALLIKKTTQINNSILKKTY